ncbi:MAG: LytR/AlgR family response regulator transcription factor [Saprospiraceae bacterium]
MTIVSLHEVPGEATIKILPTPAAANFNLFNNPAANKIALPTSDGLIFENVYDIISVEAQENYTIFNFVDNRTILTSKAITCFEDLLSQPQFFRTNRSAAINLLWAKRYVKGKGGYVIMANGSNFSVSPANRTEFIDKLRSIFTFYTI